MRNKPNILFIMTDQQRWNTVGNAKPEKLKTPSLDQLVADGCNFVNAFCQGPICIPSRASFLTGKYVHQHRLFHNNGRLPDYETTWGDVLKENGYDTVSIGRTHTIHKGFSHISVPLEDSYLDFIEKHYASGCRKFLYNHDDPVVYPGDKEDFIEFRRTRAACDALRSLKERGNPFAMFLGYCAPHNPYVIPAPYAEMYANVEFPTPKLFDEDLVRPDFSDDNRKIFEMTRSMDMTRMTRWYYGMVSMIDDCLGRLFETLDSLELADDTIVIFTSDHGEMLGDHGRLAKGCIYEESVKIPFIMRNPEFFPAGKTVPALIESVDLFPTILDYVGLEIPNQAYRLRGKSIRGLTEGTADSIKEAVFSQLPDWIMVRIVRSGGNLDMVFRGMTVSRIRHTSTLVYYLIWRMIRTRVVICLTIQLTPMSGRTC